MARILLTAALAALLVLPAANVDAKSRRSRSKKSKVKPACDLSYLPLVPGATWTYRYVEPLDEEPRPGLRLAPPDTVTIEVVSVEDTGKKAATIKLKESYRSVVKDTVLSCSEDGLVASPHSFFFAAEFGGGLGMNFDKLRREGVSFPGAKTGLKRGTALSEEISADIVRIAGEGGTQLPNGWLELEREVAVGDSETVVTNASEYRRGVRVDVTLAGRAGLAGDKESSVEMRTGSKSTMWFVSGVGLVKATNRQNQGWELVPPTAPESTE